MVGEITERMLHYLLLDNVVQVFDLSNDDQCFASGIDLIHGRFVGAALVHCDLFGNTAGPHGLVALGGQQEVDRLAGLVHGAVQVFPDALDLDVSLVHAPAAAHRALVFAKHLLKQGQKPDWFCRIKQKPQELTTIGGSVALAVKQLARLC